MSEDLTSTLLDSLLRAAGTQGSSAGESGSPVIHPLAQAMELRRRYALLSDPCEFEPGTLVRERGDLGAYADRYQAVFVVIRKLDPASSYDVALLARHIVDNDLKWAALQPDLVLGAVAFTNMKMVTFVLSPSCVLEPVTDAMLDDWSGTAAATPSTEAGDV